MAEPQTTQADQFTELVRALVLAEERLARMGRAFNLMTAPMPSTKGMDPKARAQRLAAEWERRLKEAREIAHG